MGRGAFTLIFLASFAFGFGDIADYDQKIEDNLCNLYRENKIAKYHGRGREARGIQKRIDSYKFRFGVSEIDESNCFNKYNYYYPVIPYSTPDLLNATPPYYEYNLGYNDGYYDAYQNGKRRKKHESRHPRY